LGSYLTYIPLADYMIRAFIQSTVCFTVMNGIKRDVPSDTMRADTRFMIQYGST
jgi:hypothetical protein